MTRVKGLGPFLVSVTLLAVVIGLFGFSASLNPIDVLLGRGRQTTVPDVVGMSLPRAKVETERSGLVHRTREAYSLTVPRGSIIRQEPPAGSHVRVGTTIELTVSKGENSAPMPDAVGEPLADVRGPLDAASIKVMVEYIHSETVAEGIVISQSPNPGVVLRGSETARFTVSRGAEERPVPDVRGMSPMGAAFLLGQAGFELAGTEPVDDASVAIGRVASTEPAIGTVTAKGTRVRIEVSAGPAAIPVPDVKGTSLDAARSALAAEGFTTQVAASILEPGSPWTGLVVAQNPDPGEPWRPNQSVTIVVGEAPPVPPPTTTTTTQPPAAEEPEPPSTTTGAGGRD